MGYSTMCYSILPYHCVLQVLRCSRSDQVEVSQQPWDPMAPPEVGPRRSPGLSGRVRPSEVRYRAARLRYVALCGVGAYAVLLRRGSDQVHDPTHPGILCTLLK